MGLKLTSSLLPAVSLSRAKKHLELDGPSDSHHDAHLQSLTLAATKLVEDWSARSLVNQTYVMTLEKFPVVGCRQIILPRPPLQSVTSIQYVDSDGNTQTLASSKYRVSAYREPAVVEEAYNSTWPTTRNVQEAVTVTYTAGYATQDLVPEVFQQAILLTVASWFGNRGDEEHRSEMGIPEAAKFLLRTYRIAVWPGQFQFS